MKASQLKRLAMVADVSKIETDPGPMTIHADEGTVLAWYQGLYAAAGVRILANQDDIFVSVMAQDFQQLVALLPDDADVMLKADKSILRILSSSQKLSTRYQGDPDVEGYERMADAEAWAAVERKPFAERAAAASSMVASTLTVPILTGVRMVAVGNLIGLQSSDGIGSMFESTSKAIATEKTSVIVPPTDLLTALRILQDDDFEMATEKRTLIMRDSTSVVRLPTLSGDWPKFGGLKDQEFGETVRIPAGSIRTLITAAKIYYGQTKGGINVSFIPQEGGITLETADTEKGQYREVVPGEIDKTYMMDVGDLDVAARLSELTIDIRFGERVALVTCGDLGKLYLLLRR